MRLYALFAVPLVALLACTTGDGGSARTTAAPSARPTATTTTTWTDWRAYHGDGSRHGYSATMPAPRTGLKVTHAIRLDGQVYASPLVVKGVTIVATENDTVYAFGPRYQLLWKRHLGSPSPASERPCGNVDPLGITGTPSYAGSTGLVYVAAEFSGNPPTHRLYGISVKNGTVSWSRSLDLPGVDSRVMQQRGALLTLGSGVYVPFGGLAGDCGNYKGRVVRYPLDGKGSAVAYTVPTTREAGIWTPPGATYDGTGLLVAVGNGAAGRGDKYDLSDSVLRLSTSLKRTDYFAPTDWGAENDGDVDLGSQGPAVVGKWVFQAGKSGTVYVLRRDALGGIGGQVHSASVCRSFGGTAVVGSTVYVPCTDGVRAISIDSGGNPHVKWHAAGNVTGSPVVGGHRVWTVDPDGGRLYGLDPSSGKVLDSVSVGTLSRFATPALYGHHVVLGTLRGLAVVNFG